MSYNHADAALPFPSGIQEISSAELDLIFGGSTVTDYAAHVAAVAGITAGVAAGMGCVPVAVGAGVVAGLAGAVAAFG